MLLLSKPTQSSANSHPAALGQYRRLQYGLRMTRHVVVVSNPHVSINPSNPSISVWVCGVRGYVHKASLRVRSWDTQQSGGSPGHKAVRWFTPAFEQKTPWLVRTVAVLFAVGYGGEQLVRTIPLHLLLNLVRGEVVPFAFRMVRVRRHSKANGTSTAPQQGVSRFGKGRGQVVVLLAVGSEQRAASSECPNGYTTSQWCVASRQREVVRERSRAPRT